MAMDKVLGILSPGTKEELKQHRWLINLVDNFRAIGRNRNLDKLGEIYRTDKVGNHFYTQHYSNHFQSYRRKKIKLLEIGVGGYEHPLGGGASLRMWKKWFPNAQIFAIDIHDKSRLAEKRITIRQGSQNDPKFLSDLLDEIGDLDIVIDDGSHRNDDVIFSFKQIFPRMAEEGIYVIEDTQTAYWEEYGGSSHEIESFPSSVNFFRSFIHGLNHKEFETKDYSPNYFDENILSIHFYHNLIFIHKGKNTEASTRITQH